MGNAPAFFPMVGSEKAIVNGLPYFDYWTSDALSESRFIADLFKEGCGPDEDDLSSQSLDFENGACST